MTNVDERPDVLPANLFAIALHLMRPVSLQRLGTWMPYFEKFEVDPAGGGELLWFGA